MSTSSFPTVVDLLLAKFRSLPALQAPVEVYDGMPGPNEPPLFVSIGGQTDPVEDGEVAWAQLGAKSTWEIYEINCYIWSWIGGDANSASTVGDAQKTARDAAFGLYNAMQTALLADVNLAVQNSAPTQVLYLGTNHLLVRQTPVNPSDEGAEGRVCQIDWRIHVKARITA